MIKKKKKKRTPEQQKVPLEQRHLEPKLIRSCWASLPAYYWKEEALTHPCKELFAIPCCYTYSVAPKSANILWSFA